ncbi:MAG: lipopolysaccharide heptosyltransferase II [Gammaproteobacteria bacterium]|nr:lipopolysaccharide heptosyltransferase II [Gammaproteobacteria bacterium]
MRNYLIVGPAWVGDMVMAQSLFITLKRLYPDCKIDVVAPEWSLPVLARMPEVNTGIAMPVSHGKLALLARWRLGKQLRLKHYTHAIVLPRSWKSALVPYFANVPVRTGYRGEMRYGLLNDIRELNKSLLTQTVQRFVAHAYSKDAVLPSPVPIPYPVLQSDRNNTEQLLTRMDLNLSRPVIGFMPGAEYGPAKQWPISYFAELGAKLIEAGYQVWVFGSVKERQLGDVIVQGLPEHAVNLCGKTGLVDVIDLLACADQVVSNDSGLMHIAAALDVKVNVIYGSSTPAYTPPLSNTASIFYKNLPCSPCFNRVCKFGHYDCLKKIDSNNVLSIMLQGDRDV